MQTSLLDWCKTKSSTDWLLGSEVEEKFIETEKRRRIQSESVQAKVEDISKTNSSYAKILGQKESSSNSKFKFN